MTVAYTFLTKTSLTNEQLKKEMAKYWNGNQYEVEIINDTEYQVVFFERCYGNEIEKDMLIPAVRKLLEISKNHELLYSRCNDPYYTDSPIFNRTIKPVEIFNQEFYPGYIDGEQYLYKIE